jgi:molybdopterin/thiamine biosynthesis adenylyltransferase
VYSPTSPADYSRLAGTPFNSNRLRQLTAIVVGAGALGNEVARILGLLGTGHIKVVDPDIVQPSNLPRSLFFWDREVIGQGKAVALTKAAATWFSDTDWIAIGAEIADVGFQKIANADLIFSCVDSDLARLEIAYISTKLGIPVMDAGLGRQNFAHGRVTYFPGKRETACYGCLLSPRKRRELLEIWTATLRPCTPATENGETELVSTPTMASVVGALQVEFGLRNLFQQQEKVPVTSHTLEIRLDPEKWLTEFTTAVSSDCPFHEQDSETMLPLPNPVCTIKELLDGAGADHLILDWPLCMEAKCLSCEHKWQPKLRLAALRRHGACPACGSKSILETESVRTIGHNSALLNHPVAALQLPLDHLYTVQRRADKL